jgi:hypothetical protein
VKQALFVFLLLVVSAPSFSQTREETVVYVMDIEGGSGAERRFFEDNLRLEIPAAGYVLTEDILEADYALSCDITDDEDGKGRLLVCALLDVKGETGLASTVLQYRTPEEARELLPYIIWSVFSNASLKQQPPEKVEVEKEVPVYVEVIREVEKAVPSEPPGAWKARRVFLNARAGLSSRYYLARGDTAPDASVFTFDVGVEPELRLFDFLALQAGLGFALDRAEYQRSPSNPTSVVYASSALGIPLMAKYIFNPSPQTALGPYLGAYATIPLMGMTTPPPFGLLGGMDIAVKTGLGVLLFDLRYSSDLGNTSVADNALVYHRMFITLSVGYKFGFFRGNSI